MAQFGRALRSGRRGRKFESCHLDHKSKKRGTASLFAFIVGYSSSAWLLLRNNSSSHIPPEDLQARLQGAGRGYHGAKRSYLVTSTKTQEGEGLSLSFLSFSQSPPIPNFSNALHLIVLRPKRLRKMIHLGAKQGSESCHLDQNSGRRGLVPLLLEF